MKRPVSLTYLLLGVLCWCGCGINVEMGEQIADDARQMSEARGKQVRSEWRDRLVAASPVGKAVMLKTLVDSVSARYVTYGQLVAERWRQGNDQRGEEVPDSEMQQLVNQWTEAEKPLLQSYQDVTEYAFEHIRQTRHFDQISEELMADMIDHFYRLYGEVFNPTGGAAGYEHSLGELQRKTEHLSRELDADLERYQ